MVQVERQKKSYDAWGSNRSEKEKNCVNKGYLRVNQRTIKTYKSYMWSVFKISRPFIGLDEG